MCQDDVAHVICRKPEGFDLAGGRLVGVQHRTHEREQLTPQSLSRHAQILKSESGVDEHQASVRFDQEHMTDHLGGGRETAAA